MSYAVLIIHRHDGRCGSICEILQEYFLPHDLEITHCGSYEEAFGPLISKRWDLVLIDSSLPTKDGLETLRYVRGILNNPKIPTVIFSHDSNQLLIEEAMAHGADDFLTHDVLSSPSGKERLLGHLFKLSKAGDHHVIN